MHTDEISVSVWLLVMTRSSGHDEVQEASLDLGGSHDEWSKFDCSDPHGSQRGEGVVSPEAQEIEMVSSLPSLPMV